MTQEYCATVVRLGEIQEIKGANTVAKTLVNGRTIVIGKDHKEGDVMIYCSNESQLNFDFLSVNNLFQHIDRNCNAEEVNKYLAEHNLTEDEEKEYLRTHRGYFDGTLRSAIQTRYLYDQQREHDDSRNRYLALFGGSRFECRRRVYRCRCLWRLLVDSLRCRYNRGAVAHSRLYCAQDAAHGLLLDYGIVVGRHDRSSGIGLCQYGGNRRPCFGLLCDGLSADHVFAHIFGTNTCFDCIIATVMCGV